MKKSAKIFLGIIGGICAVVLIFVAYFVIYNYMPIEKNNPDEIISYCDDSTDIVYKEDTYIKINPDGQYEFAPLSPSEVGFSKEFEKCLLSYKTKQEIYYPVSSKYNTFSLKHDRIKENIGYFSIGDLIICNNGSAFMTQQHKYYLKKESEHNIQISADNVESIKIFAGDLYDCEKGPSVQNEKMPEFLNLLAYNWDDLDVDLLDTYNTDEFISAFMNEFYTTGALEKTYDECCKKFGRDDVFYKLDFKDSQKSLVFTKYAIHNMF